MALNAWMDSRRIRRRPCRRGKLRGDVAVKDRWPDMIEAALEISPDFSADIGPALAERKILAEIGPTLRIDHALEQGKTVRASCERVEGMFAEELQGCVGWMLAHSFEHVAPDHQEAGAGVTDAGKAVDSDHVIGIVDLEHVIERGGRHFWTVRLQHSRRLVPVDALDGIDP